MEKCKDVQAVLIYIPTFIYRVGLFNSEVVQSSSTHKAARERYQLKTVEDRKGGTMITSRDLDRSPQY
jgi:hypothetical protein